MKLKIIVQKINENGNLLNIETFCTGDSIGANLIFSNINFYPMTIASISKTCIIHMKKDLVLDLCKNNYNFMINLLTDISDKTVMLTKKIDSLSFKTIRQHLLEFLIYEYNQQKNLEIKLNISKKFLAQKFGIHRSSLSRELHKMRKEGLIEYTSSKIIIKNTSLFDIFKI